MSPCWHDGPLTALTPGDGPVVWSVALARDAAQAARATADDLADAASVADGAARLTRRRLARALLARLAAVPDDAVRLSRSPHGAPIVVEPEGWHIGLSGRGGDCLIGAARRPIAVDREPLDDAAPLRDMLTPAERGAQDRLPEADRAHDWLRRWTIKEAHAKLIGEPLRIAPEAIETDILSPAPFVPSLSKDMSGPHASTGSARTELGEATATFEGTSRCWTRQTATAIETVALWP